MFQALQLLKLLFGICCCHIKSNGLQLTTHTSPVSLHVEDAYQLTCPPLHVYNTTTKTCECFRGFLVQENVVKCTEYGGLSLQYNFCMTYDEELETISITFCSQYFELRDHSISEPGFIYIPDNITELNDYMCGSMNRKGTVCSDCADGFGPSITTLKFHCSDCTNTWQGILLYLALELLPVTIFYAIILTFQPNIMSAPMVSFILYSNIIIITSKYNSDERQDFSAAAATLYSIWTLDFFRFAVPPFCVSPNLRTIHIFYLQSLSTIFPFFLIMLTWACITLHSHNIRLIVWTWELLNKAFFKHINAKWESTSTTTIVNVFATFFLLSFAKLTFLLILPLYPLERHSIDTNLSSTSALYSFIDPTAKFQSTNYLPFIVISTLLFLISLLPLVFLLALYPFRGLRSLLFKCVPGRSIGPINIFVEKFYCCYRDGLNGGRDMRSFASLYFFVVLFCYILLTSYVSNFLIATLFGGCSLLIVIIQPYKEKYMSVGDALILANMALLTISTDRSYQAFPFIQVIQSTLVTLPVLGLISSIIYRKFRNRFKITFRSIKVKMLACFCKKHKAEEVQEGNTQNDSRQLPDRIVHPELYAQEDCVTSE